ncbi:hypothetical protein ACVIHI_002447 [Bradyrhizobium sp. USDA 4524]|uniref:hypothetical protein n=1 Tax=unclassified Bradyrhizobium TaxID=2631580 RepID=UPI00209C7E40|nr:MULTISPECIES: hypothetical protein [unclassified Bradyrhizobium]MCP1844629.1 hypothetical protein [Bradyrhizobium sp. USDA 4538]MCP1905195.1 hypothetical protein [Bradyrhizobium sp. USDA 4537]MCP1989149.1 hypothetical protein [Bradyrhizobium sp. USDA 4539]
MDTRDPKEKGLDDRLNALTAVRPDCLYFAITLTADDDGKVIFGTQTEWVGWSDEDRREELRTARLVYPQFVELWRHAHQPYAVVHTPDELCLFLIGGRKRSTGRISGTVHFSSSLGKGRTFDP